VGNLDLRALALPVALGEGRGDPQPELVLLEMFDRGTGELRPLTRPGEADQQQGAVTQPRKVGVDWREDLAQERNLSGELRLRALAILLRQAIETEKGLSDHREGGRGGEACHVVQIGDGGEPQPQCVGGAVFLVRSCRHKALRGEEGGDVGRLRGEGGQAMRGTSGGPGAHAGAVGVAGKRLGGALGGYQCAVGRGDSPTWQRRTTCAPRRRPAPAVDRHLPIQSVPQGFQ
jgi:hypothetical protein